MRLRDRYYGRKPDDETAPPQAEESAPIAGLNPAHNRIWGCSSIGRALDLHSRGLLDRVQSAPPI